ncbi:MAG: hypothetical protein KDA93_08855 [Planctomycetaceae bacterium]|nr:hypothetical protein [Planctomycetaceae bacterium]
MRVIHTSHHGPRHANEAACDWLEVRLGRTRFPHRPLFSSRILIGSGTNCHLQLGGDVPMLHSLLTFENGCWTLDVIAPEPTLCVNGETCRHRNLCIGDQIQLAEFEFVLCRSENGCPRDESGRPHWRSVSSVAHEGQVAELSAAELLQRMEAEMSLVESFEEGRRRGAKALLEAAVARPQILSFRNRQQSGQRRAA